MRVRVWVVPDFPGRSRARTVVAATIIHGCCIKIADTTVRPVRILQTTYSNSHLVVFFMYDRRSPKQRRWFWRATASASDCQKFGTTRTHTPLTKEGTDPCQPKSGDRLPSFVPFHLSSRQQISQDGTRGLFFFSHRGIYPLFWP